MLFLLGTAKPHWLEDPFAPPLFVSRRSFCVQKGKRKGQLRKKLPRAAVVWGWDGGGFTELDLFGRWTVEPELYAAQGERCFDEVGSMLFASPQDWMCEAAMLAKTGLSVYEHQRRTIESVLRLRALAPRVPWIPVLQGWTLEDYRRHAGMYEAAGVHLTDEKTVGLGSICRRQATKEATRIVYELAGMGIRIHAFGAKTLGLPKYGHLISSADSMAWSAQARHKKLLLEECRLDPEVNHANCANCARWAYRWRDQVISKIAPEVVPADADFPD